jgi:hypothetical protein
MIASPCYRPRRRIDGRSLPMNSSISADVRGTILGMLSPLKGLKKRKVEISI